MSPNFRKYQHLERFGTTEVEGIELGLCYVFPKIDGTNASVWAEQYPEEKGINRLFAGSRKRVLSPQSDNAGFCHWMLKTAGETFAPFFREHPNLRLFGEWLVPHSLKTYKDDAWRRFYVFDVAIDKEDGVEYLPYDTYKPLMDQFGFDYIPPIAIIKNGSYERFIQQLDKNVFQIEDGKGVGEGIVVKNYDFYNKYGRQTWAKIVSNEFKELHHKEMGAPQINEQIMVEERIIDMFCTTSLIEKTYAKIVNEMEGWSSKHIPRLLQTVYYDLVNEDAWSFVKEFKNPTINFKTLKHLAINKIKEVKPQIFS